MRKGKQRLQVDLPPWVVLGLKVGAIRLRVSVADLIVEMYEKFQADGGFDFEPMGDDPEQPRLVP